MRLFGGRAYQEEGAARAKALRQEGTGFEEQQKDAEARAEGVSGMCVAGSEVLEVTGSQREGQ